MSLEVVITDAFDFVLKQLVNAFIFLRDTEIFGFSLFDWIAGISVGSFVIDIFVGGGEDSAD